MQIKLAAQARYSLPLQTAQEFVIAIILKLYTILSKSRLSFVVCFLAACMFLPALGQFGFMDPSDGLYAEGAREMIESGNYLTPHVNYVPFLEKPILVYWLIAASFKIFGINEFAARLPAAIAAIETAVFVYCITSQFASRRAAFISSVIMISNLLYAVVGHLALTDMELTCLATVSALSLFCALNADSSKRSWLFLSLAYVCLALSVLLKGPVLLVITCIVFTIYKLILNLVSQGDSRTSFLKSFLKMRPLAGLAIISALTIPWFAKVNQATNGAFYQEFFIHQNIGRITGLLNHLEPWWFYLPIIAVTFFPWSLLAPMAVPILQKTFVHKNSLTKRNRLYLFSLIWAITYFGIFTAIKTKLPPYILPGVPMGCIFLGLTLDTWARVRSKVTRRLAIGSICTISAATLLAVMTLYFAYMKYREPSGIILLTFIFAAISLSAGTVSLFVFFEKNKRRLPATALALVWYFAVVFLAPASLLHFYKLKQADFRQIVDTAGTANLATLWRDTTAGIFYHRKKILLVRTVEDMQNFLGTRGKPHLIIVTKDLIPFLHLEARKPYIREIASEGRFFLFDLDDSH